MKENNFDRVESTNLSQAKTAHCLEARKLVLRIRTYPWKPLKIGIRMLGEKQERVSAITTCPLAQARGSASMIRIRRRVAAALCAMLASVISFSAPGQEPTVRLSGNISPAVARAQMVDRVKPGERIRFTITLPISNEPEFNALLKDIYTPGNPHFHHFLKKGEFAQRFGASEADYNTISNFVTSQGLEVVGTHQNRLLLDVAGTADKVEKTFGFHMMHFRGPDGRVFHAPDEEPHVPASIAKKITGIAGLDDAIRLHSVSARTLSHARQVRPVSGLTPNVSSQPAFQGIGSGVDGGLIPSDIISAYLGSGLTLNGKGQTISLVEFDGFNLPDVNYYTNYFHLGALTPETNLVDGFGGAPVYGGTTQELITETNEQIEVTLDIELAMAIAPQAQVVVYEAANNGNDNLDVYNAILDADTQGPVSTSWGIAETDLSPMELQSENNTFKAMGAQGQSMYAASGDSGNEVVYDDKGDLEGGVSDPASQPYVTGVGGTRLMTSGAGGAWSGETVWNDAYGASGGGVSTIWSLPYYQEPAGGGKGCVNPYTGVWSAQSSTSMRNVPDVALNADDGYSPYQVSILGYWYLVGGTSCAAPLWAGYTALVNQQAVANGKGPAGCINFITYVVVSSDPTYYSKYFHDITSGDNDFQNNSSTSYSADQGYDNCTGWGSFSGLRAIISPNPLNIVAFPTKIPFPHPPYINLSWLQLDPNTTFYTLQENTSLRSSNWVDVPIPPVLSNGLLTVTLPATNPAAYFRLNPTPPCVPPPAGLVNWWPADGSADDIAGGNNGYLAGGVTYTDGEVGEAFNFDGSSGYVATSLLVTNPQTFSLTLWFQTTTTNGGVLISFDSDQYIQYGDSYDRNIYMDNSGALHFGVWNGGPEQINSGSGYNDGNWHYVVGSLSAATGLSLYIDGFLVGNNLAVTNAQETYSGYWRIGQDNLDNWPSQFQPNSYFFQGQIDEAAIFNTVLSSANAAAIFDAGSGGMCQP